MCLRSTHQLLLWLMASAFSVSCCSARGLVTTSSSTSTTSSGGAGRPPTGFGGGGFVPRFGTIASDLHAAIGWNVLLYAIGGIFVIALVGSAVPAYAIAKVRPAEVLRGE